jgi:hypothetical protein
MSPVRYELGLYFPEDDILHSHRQDLKSYNTEQRFLSVSTELRGVSVTYVKPC